MKILSHSQFNLLINLSPGLNSIINTIHSYQKSINFTVLSVALPKMIKTFTGKRILHLIIIFHLNKTKSAFKIIDVEDLPKPRLEQNFENNFVFKDNPPKYRRFFDYNEIEDENLKHRNRFNSLNDEDNGFKNKILVKRKRPHGISPTGVEYDQMFDTVYKPLVRIHKTKSIINQFLNEITPNKDTKHERVIFVLPNKPNYNKFKPNHNLNDQHLIQPNVVQLILTINRNC